MNDLHSELTNPKSTNETLLEALKKFKTENLQRREFCKTQKDVEIKKTIFIKLLGILQKPSTTRPKEIDILIYIILRVLLREQKGNEFVSKKEVVQLIMGVSFNKKADRGIREESLKCMINALFKNAIAQDHFIEADGLRKLLLELSNKEADTEMRYFLARLLFHFTYDAKHLKKLKALSLRVVMDSIFQECLKAPGKRKILSDLILVYFNLASRISKKIKELEGKTGKQNLTRKDRLTRKLITTITEWWDKYLEPILLFDFKTPQDIEYLLKLRVVSLLFEMPAECVKKFEGNPEAILKNFSEILITQLKKVSPEPLSEEDLKKKKEKEKRAEEKMKKKRAKLIKRWEAKYSQEEEQEMNLQEFLLSLQKTKEEQDKEKKLKKEKIDKLKKTENEKENEGEKENEKEGGKEKEKEKEKEKVEEKEKEKEKKKEESNLSSSSSSDEEKEEEETEEEKEKAKIQMIKDSKAPEELLPIISLLNKVTEVSSDARDFFFEMFFNAKDSGLKQMILHHSGSHNIALSFYTCQFLFYLADENAKYLVSLVGFQNVAGFLVNKGLVDMGKNTINLGDLAEQKKKMELKEKEKQKEKNEKTEKNEKEKEKENEKEKEK
ncbi:synembryn [Anaeramoeba flamelloides]|uniref:Synembryn n=1 Tax=Anaeramoeba flamelloides TaxID=1746091 RepID=A0AAV7ZYJ6_9EUKA|nr:synembryn [Anaeramoeba flamelloides]